MLSVLVRLEDGFPRGQSQRSLGVTAANFIYSVKKSHLIDRLIDRKITGNYSVNFHSFFKQKCQIYSSSCEDVLLFFALRDCKLNIFGLWSISLTK